MAEPSRTLEGWAPEPGPELPLARIIDLAFDYRGNTTVVLMDGTELPGYLFNRDADTREPYVQIFGADGAGPVTIAYSRIRTIRFTGRDTAAGNSYAAWRRRKEEAETARVEPGAGRR